jgi:hypothetical protein
MSRKRKASANQGRSDQDILNLFIEKYRGLAETSLGQTGFSVNHQITYGQAGITTMLDQPDEDAIRSFLLTVRQFASENEHIFLGRVCGVCYRYLEDDTLRDQIEQVRKTWASVQRGWGANMVFNGVDLCGVKIFDVWVNGWYFHNDADYKQLLDSAAPIVWQWLRAQFISFIVGIMYLVQDLCQVILAGFDEDPGKSGFILLHPA